jgi:hypothetical protein
MLENPNVQDRPYKRPKFIPILTQMDQVHALQSCFFKILLNNILPSTPTISKRSFCYAAVLSKPPIAGLYSHDCGILKLFECFEKKIAPNV